MNDKTAMPPQVTRQHWEQRGYKVDKDTYPWVAFKTDENNKIVDQQTILTDREFEYSKLIEQMTTQIEQAAFQIAKLRIALRMQTNGNKLLKQRCELQKKIIEETNKLVKDKGKEVSIKA